MNTTNAEEPFRPGDIIEHEGEQCLVIRNYCDGGGRVRSWPIDRTEHSFDLRWDAGEEWRKVGEMKL